MPKQLQYQISLTVPELETVIWALQNSAAKLIHEAARTASLADLTKRRQRTNWITNRRHRVEKLTIRLQQERDAMVIRDEVVRPQG